MSEAAFEDDAIAADIPRPRRSRGLRLLAVAWAVVALALGAGAVTLQVLGPPRRLAEGPPADGPGAHPKPMDAHLASVTHPASPPQPATASDGGEGAPHATAAKAEQPGSVHAPDAALLEGPQSARLPRIAADGRTARVFYAGAFDPADRRPRVAVLLGGLGQSESDTEEATRALPAAISFAISPYTMRPDRLLDAIRASGHEMLIELPMEPQNYPVNDEGSFSLLTGVPVEQNEQRLDWALSRIQGYVGATNALDGLRGERFSASTVPIGLVLDEIAARGLLYVDATPALSRLPANAAAPVRGVDLVLDEPAVRSEIDAKLAQLEQLARDRGTALGLAGLPRPVTLSRLAAWASGLDQRGLALVPVTRVVSAVPKREATPMTQRTVPTR